MIGSANKTVIAGLYKGRIGKVVSLPWIGNLFHLWFTLNVPATEEEVKLRYDGTGWDISELLDEVKTGHGPREWINIWRWNVN